MKHTLKSILAGGAVACLCLQTQACKSPGGNRGNLSSTEASPSKDTKIGQLKLSAVHITITGQLAKEFAGHILKFESSQGLLGFFDRTFTVCGDSAPVATPSFTSLFENAAKLIPGCLVKSILFKDARARVQQILTLRRSKEFEDRIDEFNTTVLPAVLDQIPELLKTSGASVDQSSIEDILSVVNSVALRAQALTERVIWRPGYFKASRYLHSVVLAEISKQNPSEIDWELVNQAVDSYLSIVPFSPGDTGVSPLTVPLKDPLYKVLYGPGAHGQAHWVMLALATLRKPVYLKYNAEISFPPQEVDAISNMTRQTLLETQDDQKAIAKMVETLKKNYDKVLVNH